MSYLDQKKGKKCVFPKGLKPMICGFLFGDLGKKNYKKKDKKFHLNDLKIRNVIV